MIRFRDICTGAIVRVGVSEKQRKEKGSWGGGTATKEEAESAIESSDGGRFWVIFLEGFNLVIIKTVLNTEAGPS